MWTFWDSIFLLCYSQTGQCAATHFLLPNAQKLFNKQRKKRKKKKLFQDLSYIFKMCQYQNQANPSVF